MVTDTMEPVESETEMSEQQVDEAAEQLDQAEPELTPAQIAEHAHYEQIIRLNEEVCTAKSKWSAAKDKASALKKEYDALAGELSTLIKDGPELQQRLPLKDGASPIPNDAWRSQPVNVLDISESLAEKLAECSLPTLGDLSDFWKAGKVLTDFNGIGETKAASIADAFADYGTKHPELFGEVAVDETAAAEETAEGEQPTEVEDDDEFDDDEGDADDWDGEEL